MPALLSALGSLLTALLGWFIGKILALIGFGFITYIGVKPLYDNVMNRIRGMMRVSSPDALPLIEWLGVLRVDIMISILISAIGIRMIMQGLTAAGGIKKARLGGGDK